MNRHEITLITIASVNVRNYRGVGTQYVNALYGGCVRHLSVPFRFVCFTDDASGLNPKIEPAALPRDTIPAGHHGVYYKLAMFRPGAFIPGERVLFLDLDTVVLSSIDDIAACRSPFAMLRDPWQAHALNSSVMAWEFQPHHHDLWHKWVGAGYPTLPAGDQGWISDNLTDVSRLQDLFPDRIRSFDFECRKLPTRDPRGIHRALSTIKEKFFPVPYPHGAGIIYFQRDPKPNNCHVDWVQKAWQPV